LKRLGVRYVVARASDDLHGDILSKIGVDAIVNPEVNSGTRLAHWIHQRNVVEYITIAGSYGLAKLIVPAYFVGKSLSSLGFGQEDKKALCVLVLQRGEDVTINPKLKETVQNGDVLIVAADDNTLEQLLNKALKDYEKGQQDTNKNNK
ncbi:TrkA C-terminal domain-containing protein, partial [Chloroflexota bacterium]